MTGIYSRTIQFRQRPAEVTLFGLLERASLAGALVCLANR